MKRIVIIILSLVLLMSTTGCGGKGSAEPETETERVSAAVEPKDEPKVEPKDEPKEVKKKEKEVVKTGRSLEGLKDTFKDSGFELGENELIAFEMLEATNGMKFTLDDELIEIYEYNLGNLTDEAKEVVRQAETGSVEMSGFIIPVEYKDGLMITRQDEHSQKEKILDIFNKY